MEAVQKYGLKKRHLQKFMQHVSAFYTRTITGKQYTSELVITYQKRFVRYRDSLFTFLEHDGVPWHNDVIAYCTPCAWLACLLKLTFILVMRVFARRWEQHDPTAISVVHGNAPSSPPIPDRLWRDSIGLSGFSGG